MLYDVGLVRVSSRKQEEGLSIANQSERLTAAGCNLLLEYTESGFKKNRQTFGKLRELATLGEVRSVKAIRVDRAGRLVGELLELIDFLQAKGIKIEFFDVPADLETASGRLMLTQMAAYAEYFSRELSEKQMNVNKYKREHGIPRSGRFGYRFDREKRILVPDDREYGTTGMKRHEVARLVIQQAALIGTARGLVKWTISRFGIPDLPERERIPGSSVGIAEWLLSPVLRGYLYYPKYDVLKLGQHEPLMSEAEYVQIKGLLDLARQRRGYGAREKIHPLSGLIYCTCGSICSITGGGNKANPHYYYACDAHRKKRCPDQPPEQKRRFSVRSDKIERLLLTEFGKASDRIASRITREQAETVLPVRILEIDRETEEFKRLLSGSMGDLAKEAIARLELERSTLIQSADDSDDERISFLLGMTAADWQSIELLPTTKKRSIYHWLTERIVLASREDIQIKLKI